jgi:hypothetical protein
MDGPSREGFAAVGVLALLVVRGLLLWILIPIGFVLWLLVFGWTARVGLGAFIGWLDLNLVAALQRVLIRPVSGQLPMPRVEFVPVRRVQSVSHRVHLVYDPF